MMTVPGSFSSSMVVSYNFSMNWGFESPATIIFTWTEASRGKTPPKNEEYNSLLENQDKLTFICSWLLGTANSYRLWLLRLTRTFQFDVPPVEWFWLDWWHQCFHWWKSSFLDFQSQWNIWSDHCCLHLHPWPQPENVKNTYICRFIVEHLKWTIPTLGKGFYAVWNTIAC